MMKPFSLNRITTFISSASRFTLNTIHTAKQSVPSVRNTALSLLRIALAASVLGHGQTVSACDPGWTDLGGGQCEMVLNYNGTATTIGTVQYVTVPAGVTQMKMVAAGAEGQTSYDWGTGKPSPGGLGGRQTAFVTVVPGDTLNVYVGQQGATVPVTPIRGWELFDPNDPNIFTISGAFGGGGITSSDMGGFGGGGSFVFDMQPIPGDPNGAIGNLLVAAGGGGGGGTEYNQIVTHGVSGPMKNAGGAGTGAGTAVDGVAVGLTAANGGFGFTPGPGTGASLLGGGSPGWPAVPANYFLGQVQGWPGSGPAMLPDPSLPLYLTIYLGTGGGTQSACCSFRGYAGAGGGGYYGGGGGGNIESNYTGGGGGGGSGYVDPNATSPLAETGVWSGDGQVILSYDMPALPTITALSPAAGSIGTTVSITGTGFTTATGVSFNGKTAIFTVGSATQITAVVPSGATTGRVTVLNGTGSATSPANFTVTAVPTTLSALKISAGTLSPAFTSATTAYTSSVAYAMASSTVTATATSAGASVSLSVNGAAFVPLISGQASSAQPLAVGANKLVVRVTAPGAVARDYTLTVSRTAPSTVATLSGLTTTAGAITPKFAAATLAYSATTTATAPTATVTATVTAGSNATVKYQVGSTAGAWTALTSGVSSPALQLVTGGPTTIYLLITAQDGVTAKTYSLVVNRTAPSTVKTLSALKLSAGVLAPAFSSATLTYSTTLPVTTTSYTLTATVTAASGATLACQVGTTGSWVTMLSAKATAAIVATTGTTPVRVRVTAQNGTFQDYVINVKK